MDRIANAWAAPDQMVGVCKISGRAEAIEHHGIANPRIIVRAGSSKKPCRINNLAVTLGHNLSPTYYLTLVDLRAPAWRSHAPSGRAGAAKLGTRVKPYR